MIFVLLFVVAVLGILFLHYSTRKETDEKLLHRLRKSCSINSVQFEKDFVSFVFFVKKQSYRIYYQIKKIFSRCIEYKNRVLNTSKKKVRKKLFIQRKEKEVSEFISEMKK